VLPQPVSCACGSRATRGDLRRGEENVRREIVQAHLSILQSADTMADNGYLKRQAGQCSQASTAEGKRGLLSDCALATATGRPVCLSSLPVCFVCLFVCLSVLFVCLFVRLFVQFVCSPFPFVCFVCRLFCFVVGLFVCLFYSCLFVCLFFVCLFVCPWFVCLPTCLVCSALSNGSSALSAPSACLLSVCSGFCSVYRMGNTPQAAS
jgi:hypothetical protein